MGLLLRESSVDVSVSDDDSSEGSSVGSSSEMDSREVEYRVSM